MKLVIVLENIVIFLNYFSYIFVKSDYKILKIDLVDILYLEGLGDYVCIYLLGGKKVFMLEKMKNLVELFFDYNFICVYKFFLVVIDKIEFIE